MSQHNIGLQGLEYLDHSYAASDGTVPLCLISDAFLVGTDYRTWLADHFDIVNY